MAHPAHPAHPTSSESFRAHTAPSDPSRIHQGPSGQYSHDTQTPEHADNADMIYGHDGPDVTDVNEWAYGQDIMYAARSHARKWQL